MPVIGITGGVASGKTTACSLLADALSADVFDADMAVREMLATDPIVRSEVIGLLGDEVVSTDSSLDRKRIQKRIFSDGEARVGLERILHPRVRSRWEALVEENIGKREGWLLLEIPLLFETGADLKIPQVVATACSLETQLRRLANERGLSNEDALKMINAQTSQQGKIAKASWVLWNDSKYNILAEQVSALSLFLEHEHG